MKFLVIEQNSDVLMVTHDKDEEGGTLSMLQTAVEGLVEYARADRDYLGFDADVWVNEEGLYRDDFTPNILASVIVGRPIVGPAVIALSDSEGETIGLSDEQLDTLSNRLIISRGKDNSGYHVDSLSALRAIERMPKDSEEYLDTHFECEGCGEDHDIECAVIYNYFDYEGRQTMYFCPSCADTEGVENNESGFHL
jgi:hypothetical protein